jgi:hypothetical protein
MSTIVYRDGDKHTVRGVKCEQERIEPADVRRYLEAGWRLTPAAVVVLPEEIVVDPMEEPKRNLTKRKAK